MANTELVIEIKAELGRIKSQLNQVSSEMRRSTEGIKNAFGNIRNEVSSAILTVGKYAAAFYAAYAAVKAVQRAVEGLVKVHDEYKTLLAGTAATLTSLTEFSAGAEAGQVFKDWYSYLEQVYQKLTEIDAQILGTRDQAMEMLQVFAQHGVAIDISNQKQMEGLRNLMNAVMTITAGQNQEIQIRQEINALLEAQNRETNRLFRLLQAIDPEIENHLKLWKEQGTIIENVGKLLEGFNPAASLLENTFEAQKTTLSSIVKDILRGGFEPFFGDAVNTMQTVIAYLRQHKQALIDIIKNWLMRAKVIWEWIKDTLKLIWNSMSGQKTVWEEIWSIAKGLSKILAYLAGSTLPGIIQIVSTWLNIAKALYYYFQAVGAAMVFQFDRAKKAFETANKTIKEAAKDPLGIEAAKKGYERTKKMLEDITNIKLPENKKEEEKGSGVPYQLITPQENEETKKELERLQKEWGKTKKKLEMEIKTTGLDNYQKKLIELAERFKELREKFKTIPEAEGIIRKWYEVQVKALVEAHARSQELLKLQDQIKDIELQALLTEEDRYETVSKLIPVYEQIERTIKNQLQKLQPYSEEWLKLKDNLRDVQEQIYKLREEQRELSDDFFGGFLAGLEELGHEMKSTFKKGKELAQEFAQAIQDAFSTFAMDMFEGKLKSLHDYLMAFLRDIYSALVKYWVQVYIVQNLVNSASGWLAGLFGGGGGSTGGATTGMAEKLAFNYFRHEGGLVYHLGGLVRKLHYGGLAPDEVPVILQRGEYVISKKGVEFLDKINQAKLPLGNVNVAVNVVNETGIPVNAEQRGARFDGEKYIVDVVLKNIYHYGPLRHAIAGVK